MKIGSGIEVGLHVQDYDLLVGVAEAVDRLDCDDVLSGRNGRDWDQGEVFHRQSLRQSSRRQPHLGASGDLESDTGLGEGEVVVGVDT